MRTFIWSLTIFIFVFLQYSLIFGENGLLEYNLSQQKIQVMREQNQQIMQANEKLRQEVRDFKTGLQEIESEARYQLGMIKKGEKFLWIPNTETSQ